MAIEQRDFIRWFKKGWIFTVVSAVIGILASRLLGVERMQEFITTVVNNPTSVVAALIALGLMSIAWVVIVFPVISGYLIEEVDKRVRK